MSQVLVPLSFPLHGSRLIEASAGTGKTWTIAALYLRLVLGHGGNDAFVRPLLPSEILVMTFTRAATRELSNRIRERLVEAAKCFRGEVPDGKGTFLYELIEAYAPGVERQQAAHRLMLAADTMDEAAIFTIDAWCQRMLREHAFDSGSLFDEELVSDESALLEDAVRDYWRQHVYPLNSDALVALRQCWPDVSSLEQSIHALVKRADLLGSMPTEPMGVLIERIETRQKAQLDQLKQGWAERADRMQQWIGAQLRANPKCFNGTKLKEEKAAGWLDALRRWSSDARAVQPDLNDTAWRRLAPTGIQEACSKGITLDLSADFDAVPTLKAALNAIEPLEFSLVRHAASTIARRMSELKQRTRQFGFSDMLERLKSALEGPNGPALRARIALQFPIAMIDEFQDTSPDQYQIFNALYRVAENDPSLGLFLIGDPKQSIYGFRGADIHSYLSARRATDGRHYLLGTNYRSTEALVNAINSVFLHAEGERTGFPAGAFKFRNEDGNPLPFEAVHANGRAETLVGTNRPMPALTFWCSETAELNKDDYRTLFAAHCAEHIVTLLNDPAVGFQSKDSFIRLKPADIAVLVRDRNEAEAIRRALQRRKVASVYLSDKDSVVKSDEAADVLRWLHGVANPLEGNLARAAFATRTAGLSLAVLAKLASDDLAWEARVEQLKDLHLVWQRQGVLAMLRRFVHDLGLPASLLKEAGGERRLTNLLHLAELLQSASQQLDGEQALIRWLAEQIENESDAGEERVLRLESDAELVKVVTVHKSKGLEYPLVFLPFAVSARPASKRNRSFLEFTDDAGAKIIDLSLSEDALAEVESARIEEDLRLLYVALTRACHALWLGVASLKNKIHESALGYLLAGGKSVESKQLIPELTKLRGDCSSMQIEEIEPVTALTLLSRLDERPALIDAPEYSARFERDWSVGSFTSLTRAMTSVHAPTRPLEDKLLEDDDIVSTSKAENEPWHRFPRGPLPGQFLHEQLEWMGFEGFNAVDDEHFDTRLAARCERSGWGHRQDDTIAWLRMIANTPLSPIDDSLCALDTLLPEMEFWFPSERLRTRELDLLCREHLLDKVQRPALPERELHGMLKGFADLVFEHHGRYWVLDYKSNSLGADDASYHQQALGSAMAAHRYDIQGAIYMLALHRLLKSRLGDNYDPARHLGGAIFFFLRGIANQDTHGCYHLAPSIALLDGLDKLLTDAPQQVMAGA
jgi:exodeoxyribonuclease V beta subunit